MIPWWRDVFDDKQHRMPLISFYDLSFEWFETVISIWRYVVTIMQATNCLSYGAAFVDNLRNLLSYNFFNVQLRAWLTEPFPYLFPLVHTL
jgi:hypothetical protein